MSLPRVSRVHVAAWAAAAVMAYSPAVTPSRAACPETLCDCLGEAKRFAIVASETVTMRTGIRCYFKDGCANVGVSAGAINLSKFTLQSLHSLGYVYAPSVEIAFAPETQAVVINTLTLRVGDGGAFHAFGDPSRVLVNVFGTGPRVYIGRDTDFGVPILAPNRAVVLFPSGVGDVPSVFANRLNLRGQAPVGAVCSSG